jgi:hypothetical protein
MKTLKQYIKKVGGKAEAAKRLKITVRYVDMILAGRKPSERLVDMIKLRLMID